MRRFKGKLGRPYVMAEFKVRQDLYDAFHAAATTCGLSFSEWARRILEHHCKPGKRVPTSVPNPVPPPPPRPRVTFCTHCSRIGAPSCPECRQKVADANR